MSDYIGLCVNSVSLSRIYVLMAQGIYYSKSLGFWQEQPPAASFAAGHAALVHLKRTYEAAPQKRT